MKQNNANSKLTLKKTTIAKLQKGNLVKAGYALAAEGGIPETCGYACTDCMSTLTRTFTTLDITLQ